VTCYILAGLFGIAIATTACWRSPAWWVALDAYGPVTDNAGGIAEMAGLPKEVRKNTTRSTPSHTTKAVTRATPSLGGPRRPGVVRCLHLGPRYFIAQGKLGVKGSASRCRTLRVVGLLIGGGLPYLFGGMSMLAVGRAAQSVVEEVAASSARSPAS